MVNKVASAPCQRTTPLIVRSRELTIHSYLLYCLSRDELHPLLGGPAAGMQALCGCCRVAGAGLDSEFWSGYHGTLMWLGVFGATPKMD
eukprot:1194338-Prorocentrum_minimum.AAC.2